MDMEKAEIKIDLEMENLALNAEIVSNDDNQDVPEQPKPEVEKVEKKKTKKVVVKLSTKKTKESKEGSETGKSETKEKKKRRLVSLNIRFYLSFEHKHGCSEANRRAVQRLPHQREWPLLHFPHQRGRGEEGLSLRCGHHEPHPREEPVQGSR
jgi:hypothetical protein